MIIIGRLYCIYEFRAIFKECNDRTEKLEPKDEDALGRQLP